MGLSPIYTDTQVVSYVNRTGAAGPGQCAHWYAISCLRINRMIRPNIPEGPCGKFQSQMTGAQSVFAGIDVAAGADPEPISKGLIAGIGAIGSFFSSVFSGAPSLKELQTQCYVVATYNSFADTIEKAIRNGTVSLANAKSYLTQVCSQLSQMCTAVEGGTDSAPYSLRMALMAEQYFNSEVVYPSLAPPPAPIHTSSPGSAPSGISGTPGGVLSEIGATILNAISPSSNTPPPPPPPRITTPASVQLAQPEPVTPSNGISTNELVLILAVLVTLFAVGWAVSK